MERRFQYGVRSLLWAMFWLSVVGGAFTYFSSLGYDRLSPIPHLVLFGAFLIVTFLFVAAPCMAIGALFERSNLGLAIGAGLAVLVVAAIFFAAFSDVPRSKNVNRPAQAIRPSNSTAQPMTHPAE
jgi:hypothetical protein